MEKISNANGQCFVEQCDQSANFALGDDEIELQRAHYDTFVMLGDLSPDNAIELKMKVRIARTPHARMHKIVRDRIASPHIIRHSLVQASRCQLKPLPLDSPAACHGSAWRSTPLRHAPL